MADSAVYVNPEGASGDWAAGDNGNTGASKAQAWETLAYAIDNHASGSGDTVTIIIREDTTTDTARILFDNAAKQGGVSFIFRTETPGDKWILGTTHIHAFRVTADGSLGSVTLQDCTCVSALIEVIFFYQANMGKHFILIDSNITLTNAGGAKLFSCSTGAVDGDVTINGDTTVIVTGPVIVGPNGNLTIGDGVILTATGVDNNVIDLDYETDFVVIGAAFINQTSVSGDITLARGIAVVGPRASNRFESIGTVYNTRGNCIHISEGTINKLIKDCTCVSVADTAVSLEGLTGGGDNLVVEECTITAMASGKRGLLLGDNCDNFSLRNNRIAAASHALFAKGSGIGIISGNIVTSTESIGIGGFSPDTEIHHNTVIAASGTAFIVGAPGDENQIATKNLKVHDNIFVCTDGRAYYDYDASTGITGGDGRSIGNNDLMNDYNDYNCYWRVDNFSSGVLRIGQIGQEEDCDTLQEVWAAWIKPSSHNPDNGPWNANFGAINDRNSLIEDPLLDANFKPHNFNVATGGTPDINENPTSMGAIQPTINSLVGRGFNRGFA